MKHYLKRFIILPVFMLLCSITYAQNFTTINGSVVDAHTGYPLPFASVSLKNSTFSNVANSEGHFSLKFPDSFMNDSILISYLGYRNTLVPVSEFIGKKSKKVKLVPTTIDIRSIIVRPNDAETIFYTAFSPKYIRENYSASPVGMSGFYREIIKKGNKL